MGQRQASRKRTVKLFKRVISNSLKLPEKLTVSQWAEKYRILDESSNFKGKWNNDLTPYLVGIMDSFNDPYIQEINFVKPTQVGGTECIQNILGYIITQDPAKALIVYPTDDLAKEVSQDRIKPSLTKTPEIAERYDEKKSKILELKFRGMRMYLNGAGSASKLASKAVRYLFFDEIDKLDGASKKEASPYNLAKERTRTYTFSKKIFTCSTPTLKTNYVWSIHEAADEQREFFVPCPHCGKYFVFDFHQIKFDEDKTKSNTDRAKTAIYVCKECGCIITDREKATMLRKGEWRTTKKNCIGHPTTVSFHLNCLNSRFLTWREIALEWLKSQDDPEQLQNFINSWLAEPWEDTKLKTSKDLVKDRQTDLEELVVPEWTKLLTGGIDVQENCLYWTIRAWGDWSTSQNIAHGQALSFAEVEKNMDLMYQKASGEQLCVNLALMDSGDQTDEVYDFIAMHPDWCMPVKGASTNQLSDFKYSTINKENSKAYGMQLVIVDTQKYKDRIASRMQKENGKGSWMVYAGCDDDYAEQVTNEHKIIERNGKKKVKVWRQKYSKAPNHYLDCEVYAYAAADIQGLRTLYLENEDAAPQETKSSKTEQYAPEEDWIRLNEDW